METNFQYCIGTIASFLQDYAWTTVLDVANQTVTKQSNPPKSQFTNTIVSAHIISKHVNYITMHLFNLGSSLWTPLKTVQNKQNFLQHWNTPLKYWKYPWKHSHLVRNLTFRSTSIYNVYAIYPPSIILESHSLSTRTLLWVVDTGWEEFENSN